MFAWDQYGRHVCQPGAANNLWSSMATDKIKLASWLNFVLCSLHSKGSYELSIWPFQAKILDLHRILWLTHPHTCYIFLVDYTWYSQRALGQLHKKPKMGKFDCSLVRIKAIEYYMHLHRWNDIETFNLFYPQGKTKSFLQYTKMLLYQKSGFTFNVIHILILLYCFWLPIK